jgi:hypothetical protein
MILGMSISIVTLVHVVLSLVGIFSGVVALFGRFRSRRLSGWTVLIVATMVMTSVSGFFFPRDHVLPSPVVEILSLAVLALAILSLYVFHLAGPWRWVYVGSAVMALCFDAFVALVVFVALDIVAVKSFHPERIAPGSTLI